MTTRRSLFSRRSRTSKFAFLMSGATLLYLATALTTPVGRVDASGGSGSGSSGSGSSGGGGGNNGGGGNQAQQFLLTGLRPSDPPDLASYVTDRQAAIVLGKALFWDTQVGSDGVQACASCHYHAGADTRTHNMINPNGDPFTVVNGPGADLTLANYPFHKLSDINNSGSTVMSDSKNVGGSEGVHLRSFISVQSNSNDHCTDQDDAVFGHNRRVTGMNTPTNINAPFNFRNFWDGRAREVFNGASPIGAADANARIYRADANGHSQAVSVLIKNASAASQATGPALSGTEMSCDGRTWPKLGVKMVTLLGMPLSQQKVSSMDSVLGPYANTNMGGRGLNVSYAYLIQKAYSPDLWNGDAVTIGGDSFKQMEANFSLFWGLAIQLYEATLTSDMAPIDQYAMGNTSALSSQAIQGLSIFTGKAQCVECHRGPLLTDAVNGSGGHAFENAAVRPEGDFVGDVLKPNQGRVKTPGLRNVELTGPYFHNGGQATLAQVVDFYNRGGDFATGNTDSHIRPLGLSDSEKMALVAFLKSLTDERVKYRRAPFDGPEIVVPDAEAVPAVGAGGASTPLGTYLGASSSQH